MTPDLLGYLINALEPEETRAVEEYLESSPDAREQLRRLRLQLQPLTTWDQPEPPADFFYRTLRAIAARRSQDTESIRRERPTASPLAAAPALAVVRPWTISEVAPTLGAWRRPDVWVSIAMVVMVCLSIPPVLRFVRQRAHQVECADCMRQMHPRYLEFAERNRGFLPGPQVTGPLAHAGVVVPVLYENGLLTNQCKVGCDPNTPVRPVSLQEVRQHDPSDYAFWSRLGGSNGYHLGYLDREGDSIKLMPVRSGDGDNIPILADRPPRPGEPFDFYTGNSPNHGGRGQNVLYLGGNIRFEKNRSPAASDDLDIFLNQSRKLAAGTHPRDSVIAPSEATPVPVPIE